MVSWAWWHVPLISALGRQRQVDLCEFKAIMVYRVISRPAKATQRNPVLKNKKQNNKKKVKCHFPKLIKESCLSLGPAWPTPILWNKISWIFMKFVAARQSRNLSRVEKCTETKSQNKKKIKWRQPPLVFVEDTSERIVLQTPTLSQVAPQRMLHKTRQTHGQQ